LYPTFKEAAIARNLLADDSAWEKVMEEAVAFEMPDQLRQLFVDICCHCRLTNTQLLFNNNLQHLTEDYQRNGHGEEVAKNLALKWIQDKIVQNGEKYEDFELPIPDFQLIDRLISAEIEENDENVQRQKKLRGEMMMAKLNVGQRAAFDQIMAAINDENSPQSRQFFLDGPGGTGKTFLYNTLINVLQGEGKKIIAVASTGIASTLLIDGATYHSQFKIYPPITETTRSKKKNTTSRRN
jgi:ATP-dependent DNA helicase PIF1